MINNNNLCTMEQKANVLCLCNKNIVYVNQDKLKINVNCFYLMSNFIIIITVIWFH